MCLLWKFNKYTLTRVFVHAEFISVMKTVQNPTVFIKKAKIIENHSFLLIVWDFHWNSWAHCHKKSQKIPFRWKRRQIKQNEKFWNLWENWLNRKAIAFDNISRNCAFYGNSINIHLLGYFCMRNSYLRWKQWKMLRFSWKRKNNRKSSIIVNCLRFSLKLVQIVTKSHKIFFLDGKEDK